MQISLHEEAAQEVRAAAEWYEGKQVGLGADFLREVDRAIRVISESPETWPAWPGTADELRIRRFLLSRFPFGIAYQHVGNQIIVAAIVHMRRHPDYWKKRTVV